MRLQATPGEQAADPIKTLLTNGTTLFDRVKSANNDFVVGLGAEEYPVDEIITQEVEGVVVTGQITLSQEQGFTHRAIFCTGGIPVYQSHFHQDGSRIQTRRDIGKLVLPNDTELNSDPEAAVVASGEYNGSAGESFDGQVTRAISGVETPTFLFAEFQSRLLESELYSFKGSGSSALERDPSELAPTTYISGTINEAGGYQYFLHPLDLTLCRDLIFDRTNLEDPNWCLYLSRATTADEVTVETQRSTVLSLWQQAAFKEIATGENLKATPPSGECPEPTPPQ